MARRIVLRVTLAAASAIAVAGWAACAIYDTSLLLPAPARDAGLDAALPPPALDASAADADTCAHAHWPPPPAASDPGPALAPIVMALATLTFGSDPDAGPAPLLGYDLDNVCTCPGPDSCNNTHTTSAHCDEDGGRDNSGGQLLTLVSAFPGLSPTALDQSLASGKYGLILQVKNWNGQPNARGVTAAIYVSNGLSGKEDGGTVGPVKGDGTDHWIVAPGSVLGGQALLGIDCGNDNPQCSPVYYDDNAYVADGTLVCSLDFPISIGSQTAGTINVNLTGSVVAAKLVQTAGGWAIPSGVISGRWATAQLLSSLAALKDPSSKTGAYLCGTDSTYLFARTEICTSMDITADPKLDQTGAPCDAISLAVGFTANPAQMAEVYGEGSASQGCISDAGVPFHDDCNH